VHWQYLNDNHNLDCSDAALHAYIGRTTGFKAYFDDDKRIPPLKGTALF